MERALARNNPCYAHALVNGQVSPGLLNVAEIVAAMPGQHRSAGPIDLLACATAIHEGLTVLHRDNDLTTVARVLPEVEQQDARSAP